MSIVQASVYVTNPPCTTNHILLQERQRTHFVVFNMELLCGHLAIPNRTINELSVEVTYKKPHKLKMMLSSKI